MTGALYAGAGSGLKETIDEMNDPTEDGCNVADVNVTAGNGCSATACACPLGKTVDERSQKDGAGPEAIVVGEACGRLLAVTATEKQGTAFVFDITTISSPKLLFVHHLSPASQKKNPTVAYSDGSLGDIDPESITFLKAEESPTGNAGVLFAGAWSGTLSLYEFTASDGSKCSAQSPSAPPSAEAEAASPPPASPASSDPCFPPWVMVTRADGKLARVDSLKVGDEIVATDANGDLTTDTLSLLSVAKPEAAATSWITIATASNATLTLTPTHHLPVGPTCCSDLKLAKDVAVGETVWVVGKDAKHALASTVTSAVTSTDASTVTSTDASTVAKAAIGLFSPVLTNGGFPVVDGVVTAFDSIDKVMLAKYGLKPLLAACSATGTCETFKAMFDRE